MKIQSIKLLFVLVFTAVLTMSVTLINAPGTQYDENLVEVTVPDPNRGMTYTAVAMSRKGNRIKAKYFAAKDFNGNSVYQRYMEWSKGRKVICVSSGTYMDNASKPVGLTIDAGEEVNRNLAAFDGIVVVYATGGIAVSNLKDGNLSVNCGGKEQKFDLKNDMQRASFMACAKEVEATVFQTHLLVYKNALLVKPTTASSTNCAHPPCNSPRERRFLAGCKDDEGNIRHVIVNTPSSSAASIYEATSRVYNFLIKDKDMSEVVFMINLDTGAQDVFSVYNPTGELNTKIKGSLDMKIAANLLAYYYE